MDQYVGSPLYCGVRIQVPNNLVSDNLSPLLETYRKRGTGSSSSHQEMTGGRRVPEEEEPTHILGAR
ncbi:hypothetical protein M6B38_117990 [Iris pallida]|uniref:Uncharacterized protein n=1 Tax=Iris pallida TaxID=29817 RepID=A0AAX6HJY1_IRIPA|nr:hypothetical protein M6B38_240500 [Iris pallida]KAJ6840921.1 hypothetical protein M6B38_117990 [Iris pallida]